MRRLLVIALIGWHVSAQSGCLFGWLRPRPVPAAIAASSAAPATNRLKDILEAIPRASDEPLSADQFNEILHALEAFAADYHIALTSIRETSGVYPRGLYEIALCGLSVTDAQSVGLARRHELVHLFHTLQLRALLIDSGMAVQTAEDYLRQLEGGANYRQFEKAATGAASALHALRPESASQYRARIEEILDGTAAGAAQGKIRFPNGSKLVDVYALFLSKSPLVVGKSATDLAWRLPFFAFGTFYALNAPIPYGWVDEDSDWWKRLRDRRKKRPGLRDLVNFIFEGAFVP